MGVSVRQKTPGGPWWLFIKHRGKRTSKLVGDKKAADKLASETRLALAGGDFGLFAPPEPPPPPALTFAQYAGAYLRASEHQLKRSTWMDYSRMVERHLIPAFGPRAIADITRRDVKDLIHALRDRDVSVSVVRNVVGTLSTILSEAVEDEKIEANPVLQLRAKAKRRALRLRGGEVRKKMTPLTREQVAHLLTTALTHEIERKGKVVHPFRRFHPMLLLLAQTGMRVGEAAALRFGDINWLERFIIVERSFVRGRLDTTKNDKTRRVQVPQTLLKVLEGLKAARFAKVADLDPERQAEREATAAQALQDAYLFPDENGGPINTDNFRHRVWTPLIEAAKLHKVRIHDLRHTYASLMIEAGKALHFIQQQLGHHSPAFTLAVYGHLLPRDRRDEVDFLDALTTPEDGHSPAPHGHPEAEGVTDEDEADTEGIELEEEESAPGVIRTPDLLVRSQPL